MAKEHEEGGRVTLHLLDSAQGRPIQTWHFTDRNRLTVGRAVENDVSLSDSHVSRLHVELCYEEGRWRLYSHGRNGTLVEGVPVTASELVDDLVFQLGSSGPSLHFVTTNAASSSTPTIEDIDFDALDFLVLDEQRTADEVKQIADGDAFQALQQQVRHLKRDDDFRNSDP